MAKFVFQMNRSGKISARNPKLNSHNEWQLLLMAIPILIIAGFQVFWLRENYIKEEKNLEFRSSVVFKETVRKLQSKKLKLDKVFTDSIESNIINVINSVSSARFLLSNCMLLNPSICLLWMPSNISSRNKCS